MLQMAKETTLKIINHFGYDLHKHQMFHTKNYDTLVAPISNDTYSEEVSKEILDFYDHVPPFYTDDIKEPLRIAGAWRGQLQRRRQQQLEAIKNKDVKKYTELLNDFFRNEMIYAMWEGHYFKPEMEGKKFPHLFLEWMDGFKYLTGRSEEELTYCSKGNTWGYQASNGIIKLIDPAQGIKAQNLLNLIALLKDTKKPTICDIGSGHGGDMEKLARWGNKPSRIILLDIPLNLTTAYAYIHGGFAGSADLHLIKSTEQLHKVMSDDNDNQEFIFIPTCFVEELTNYKINILHNHGSFSEMDAVTVNFYLETLLNKTTDFMIEINSNKPAILGETHLEVASSSFTIPDTHSLFMRTPTWLTGKGHRYLNSVYINKSIISPAK